MDNYTQRAWAEVSLDAIADNLKSIKNLTNGKTEIMAVVKADAYGHGFLQVAKTLLENGANAFAVAMLDEAKQLRSRGIDVPILILGNTTRDLCEDLIAYDVMPSVFSYDMAKALSDAAAKKNMDAKIHIKLDTGMSRIGFLCDETHAHDTINEIKRISALPNIIIDGIFTHFACADEEQSNYTLMQFDRFMKICDTLTGMGINIGKRHVCNSAALILYPQMHLDIVRPGVILYGLHPSPLTEDKIKLKSAMSLKARVTMVKNIAEEIGVSYGKEYIAHPPIKLATIPIGYADGYSRLLANKAKMIYKEKFLPIVGRICMDQCMIDATNADNIKVDDIVTIMGDDGKSSITASDIASYMGTINYEIVCLIGKRIPRIYTSGKNVVRALNNLV